MADFASNVLLQFVLQLDALAAAQLKVLLETRHLYQKLAIDVGPIQARLKEGVIVAEKQSFDNLVKRELAGAFAVSEKQLSAQGGNRPLLTLILGNVKLFCAKCDSREAFRPVWFLDVTSSFIQQNLTQGKFKLAIPSNYQLFVLVYQCQNCEGTPEAFIVRREALNLTVEGRSPIEQVEIPNYIPKSERHWFRDAVIAFQTGKTLAALFYLRTFIEQFARRKTNLQEAKATGEEIMGAYSRTLPGNLRDSMPSLGEMYEKLSEALHNAKEDSELFEAVRTAIEKHFDIRRVHELDKVPEAAKAGE